MISCNSTTDSEVLLKHEQQLKKLQTELSLLKEKEKLKEKETVEPTEPNKGPCNIKLQSSSSTKITRNSMTETECYNFSKRYVADNKKSICGYVLDPVFEQQYMVVTNHNGNEIINGSYRCSDE